MLKCRLDPFGTTQSIYVGHSFTNSVTIEDGDGLLVHQLAEQEMRVAVVIEMSRYLLHAVCMIVVFRYSYMIDNIVLLITGTLHQRAISELIPKCHPLGSFEQMEAIHIASSPAELYNAVLVDTPLGKHLSLLLSACF